MTVALYLILKPSRVIEESELNATNRVLLLEVMLVGSVFPQNVPSSVAESSAPSYTVRLS